MKQTKLIRSLLAFLLAAAMMLPMVPAAYAASEVKCDQEDCDGMCKAEVLMEANCHTVGVTEYTCEKCGRSFLVKTSIDPKNHDTICTDNGDGKTHNATCLVHENYKDVKENHIFENGRCIKCEAADYSEAEIVLKDDEIELTVDLDDEKAELSVGKVAVKVGNLDVTKDYDITYSWYDVNNKVVSSDETYVLPAKITAKLGEYSYLCFIMATPKNAAAGKRLSATCAVTLNVLDLVSASAFVGSTTEAFTMNDTNDATSVSVLDQIFEAVWEASDGYPSYVVFGKAPTSKVGELGITKNTKYYFDPTEKQKDLADVEFVPAEDGSGNYVINFTVYDDEGEAFPGVLTITVERELGELDVAYFAEKGEAITLDVNDFEMFWQACNPGGELKQIIFLTLPTATQGKFYYDYDADASKNKTISDDDVFYVSLSSANQYLIEALTFVPNGKFTGQITVQFNAFGRSAKGRSVQEQGELTLFINGSTVEDVEYSLTSGETLEFDADDFQKLFREQTKSKDNEFAIRLLDVPKNGDLYLNYTGKKGEKPLTADEILGYTFYYESTLNFEIGDLTYVTAKSSKDFTDTVRYAACNNKGEIVYVGEIVFSCKKAVVVYTKKFGDVVKGDWYYTYVMDLAEAGVVNGVDEVVDGKKVTNYKPQNKVTYGEALALIMRAVGYETPKQTGEHWASGYLTKAIEDKLISSTFTEKRLGEYINRNAIAKLAALAMKLPESDREDSPLKDVTIGSTYAPYILALYDAGIITGDENECYKGTEKITRDAIAAIIWRINNYEG